MVTKQELVNGYETEIKYQRHMLENLGRWFSLLFIIASIGVVLIYLFHKSFLPLLDPRDFTSLGWNFRHDCFWIWHLPRADQSSKSDR